MRGIKETEDYYISGLVNYADKIGEGQNKGKVKVWISDHLGRGGDYQTRQITVCESTAKKHLTAAAKLRKGRKP